MKTGDLVRVWWDDGRGGGYCYGIITRAGSKQFDVRWQSGIKQRRPQDCHLVTLVPESSLDVARAELRRTEARL